ncbi:MAG: UDP-N-acetylmuramate dehydrogenase [Rhodospirillales bacterium]|nr:UDP-N-acetylmuramate dehydrogenase [Rhodospirillales bacterium]
MPAARALPRLIDRLPDVRGRYAEAVPLAPITWFRVGGPAEVVFRPADAEDLAAFVAAKPADVPLTVLGVASNLLVRDGGIAGVVVRLGRAFAAIDVSDETITAGAGALDANVARTACEAGVADFEFLSGIPGTIGGALRMNAGAYGSEINDVLTGVRVIDEAGVIRRVGTADMAFSYRHCGAPAGWIFLEAALRGRAGNASAIARRMQEIRAARDGTQPVRARTGGSTFANPSGAKAWELIDRAGCRGLVLGGAQVSPLHCNFLINTGSATAADLEALGEEVRRRVFLETGVALEWEIHRIGVPSADHRLEAIQ